jgi:hypothetical protein
MLAGVVTKQCQKCDMVKIANFPPKRMRPRRVVTGPQEAGEERPDS